MKARILLNGKKASLPSVRDAVSDIRNEGIDLEVRPTWEAGDIDRLVAESIEQGCTRIIAGGGDGTINEVVNALMHFPHSERPELAILPLGTANDFATACEIPTQSLYQALKLAVSGSTQQVDVVQAGEHYFMNMATGGFGAQVTTSTPVALKNFLGGGAYTLTGLVQALNFESFKGKAFLNNQAIESQIVIGAVCNGRQAGGGQVLSAHSYINDGLMEVISLTEFPSSELTTVIQEITEPNTSGKYVRKLQVTEIQWQAMTPMPINLDGEPIKTLDIAFKIQPKEINMVLPENCPMILGE